MNNIDEFLHSQPPTAQRPLLGATVLLVEDSLTACEAIRLMCIRSGARIRRADCIESAKRHLRIYHPAIVLIDIGLPDGSGADLIADLNTRSPRVETILALSADPQLAQAAQEAGADGFIEKPLASIAEFQAAVLQHMPPERLPRGPRLASAEQVKPDHIAMQGDLSHALELLGAGDPTTQTRIYLANFLAGVARTTSDAELENIATSFARARSMAGPETQELSHALEQRLKSRAAV